MLKASPTPRTHYPSLREQRVLITGGASGIGAAMVAAFTGQGARVAFLDIDDGAAASLRRTLAELAASAGPAQVLINNAARDDRHQLEEVTPELWDELIGVNLRHQFFASQAVLPAMAQAGAGVIVNLGSITFLRGYPDLPVYVTASGDPMACG